MEFWIIVWESDFLKKKWKLEFWKLNLRIGVLKIGVVKIIRKLKFEKLFENWSFENYLKIEVLEIIWKLKF